MKEGGGYYRDARYNDKKIYTARGLNRNGKWYGRECENTTIDN